MKCPGCGILMKREGKNLFWCNTQSCVIANVAIRKVAESWSKRVITSEWRQENEAL